MQTGLALFPHPEAKYFRQKPIRTEDATAMTCSAHQGFTRATGTLRAVADLVRQIGTESLDAVLFFCSPDYDLATVGRELKRSFPCPVMGCSSSGQIGPQGFQKGGMAALGLSGGLLKVVPHLIHPLADHRDQVQRIASGLRQTGPVPPGSSRFGLLLVERLVSGLYQALDDVPIIGGSAGDDLQFQRTQVYFDGEFLADAAVFAVCASRGAIAPFMVHHFLSGQAKLVITDSDPERRIIREFNGEPAASVYAETIGVGVDQLGPDVFSGHPLLMGFGGEQLVRSIARCHPDGSMALYCAIDTGLVVTVGQATDPVAALGRAFAQTLHKVPDPVAILACDCILRRLEFEHLGTEQQIGAFLAQHQVFGFSTYGEQFNGLHVNQTMTGLALGRPVDP
jgi:hypothetical protein